MTKQNRKSRSLGRAGALAFLLVLTASSAFAFRAFPGSPRRTREAIRLMQIRRMDIFAQNYGGANWSLVTADLMASPEGAENAAVMSIPLSLGNVYLNRYEIGHDRADLELSITRFEQVVSNYVLWERRAGSGAVISYLDISLSRLDAECDVGGFESRIGELWRKAMAITAAEADEADGAVPTAAMRKSILPIVDEEDASLASLYAAAASFLSDDSRAGGWAQHARRLAAGFPESVCQPMETVVALSQGALSFRLAGRETPPEFGSTPRGFRQTSADCPSFRAAYETNGPVSVVAPGESLAAAIRDSRVFALYLEQYLSQFPPGSQCAGDEDEDIPRELLP
jgi:hypothetical protein